MKPLPPKDEIAWADPTEGFYELRISNGRAHTPGASWFMRQAMRKDFPPALAASESQSKSSVVLLDGQEGKLL